MPDAAQPAPAPISAEPAPASPAPRTRRFVKSGPRIGPEPARRQNRIATLSWEMMSDSESARAFLNTHNDRLGGRPLDVAIGSDEGLAAVEAVLRDHAEREGRRMLREAGLG